MVSADPVLHIAAGVHLHLGVHVTRSKDKERIVSPPVQRSRIRMKRPETARNDRQVLEAVNDSEQVSAFAFIMSSVLC